MSLLGLHVLIHMGYSRDLENDHSTQTVNGDLDPRQ